MSFLSTLRTPLRARNLAWLLAFAIAASAGWTYYSLVKDTAPMGMKPYQVWRLLTVNLILLLLLASVVGWRIRKLWRALQLRAAGSRLQKRMVVTFSLITIIPTMVVTIFSVAFFNLGIQAWFNDRVNTAVEESLAVAEAYLGEHKENIRGDAIAMASDLNPLLNLAFTEPADFNRAVVTQAAVRVLTEAAVLQRGRIIAQGRYSFALAFERLSPDVMERAAGGEVVTMTTEDDKVRALVKLNAPDTFLLVGRLVDSHVIDHMENTQGAVNEYHSLKEQLTRLQVTFSGVFVSLTLVLLLGSVWYGLRFATLLTVPLARLVDATERVREGDLSTHVPAGEGEDEISALGRAFNRMTRQLDAQRRDIMAAQRSAAWADVARRVAHEIKNPLTPISLAAERLKRKYLKYVEGEEAETFVKYTDTITRHVADIGKMVEEFVSFARMPAPSFAEHDLASLLRKIMFSGQTAHSDITYKSDMPNQPVHLRCDERQIGQLLMNLLKNAAESIESDNFLPHIRLRSIDKENILSSGRSYGGQGGRAGEGAGLLQPGSIAPLPASPLRGEGLTSGTILVKLENAPDKITLSIQDNGAGFPPGHIDKLFEPYVTNRTKGTGLGLAIVKKIMDDHKGIITLNNNPSGGAIVVLSFPKNSDIKATEVGVSG